MSEPGSIAFDRAAEYYDETRRLSDEGMALNTDLLVRELGDLAPVLEVGIGTGQVALPLHEAGIPLVGLDLARPMMDRLVVKAGGRAPFPLVQADATAMPFADDAIGAAYLRWVLHLIPAWEAAVAEVVRVVRPGGVFLAQLGAYPSGPMAEIQRRFCDVAGIALKSSGLDWAAWDQLDAALEALGARPRGLPAFVSPAWDDVESFVRGVEGNRFSWTWRVSDDAVRERAAAEARRFAEETYGDLNGLSTGDHEITWRAYDLPV